MSTKTVLNILQWVVVVFAAGFIGYFGKFLAKKILRERRGEVQPVPESEEISAGGAKIEHKETKKRLKIEQKLRKKP